MKKILSLFIIMMAVSSCSIAENYVDRIKDIGFTKEEEVGNAVYDVADLYVGMNEREHRKILREFMGIDPVQTEWCAAFVNSVLHDVNLPGSEYVHDNPLLARSFMSWGEEVIGKPQTGDIVVFPRGRNRWQGHVGFFVVAFQENGKEYYIILGGNQNDEVSYEAYEANRAIAIRRWPQVSY
jgi:uncharacterized protein (TIGR02594 family)